MRSLKEEYINKLSFTQEQLSTLKTLGSYQGKQALYYEQSPEALENLKHLDVLKNLDVLQDLDEVFEFLEDLDIDVDMDELFEIPKIEKKKEKEKK